MTLFGRKRREERLAQTDALVRSIRERAEGEAEKATKATTQLNRLIAKVGTSNDFTIKLYLAMNEGKNDRP